MGAIEDVLESDVDGVIEEVGKETGLDVDDANDAEVDAVVDESIDVAIEHEATRVTEFVYKGFSYGCGGLPRLSDGEEEAGTE